MRCKMKEFIDKLISRLDEEKQENPCRNTQCKDCKYTNECYEGEKSFKVGFDNIEAIVNELAEEFKVSEMPTGWIPCSERLPSESGKYLVTAKNITGWWILENNVFVCDYAYDTFIFQGWEDNEVIAWCELPAPYTEGE